MSEIELPERMKQRRAKLLNATYEYFLAVLEMDRNEAALRFPMDEKLMWVLFGIRRHYAGTSGIQCMLPGHLCTGWKESTV